MVREPKFRATRACVRLRSGCGQSIHGEQGFLRIMRDYPRLPPQDITWNAAPSFENPASGSTTIANPEVTGTMGFSPAFTYPYVQPSNFNQMMYPVSTQRFIVHRRRWLTLSHCRTCSRLGPRHCQRLVGRILSSANGLVFMRIKASTNGDSVPSSSQSVASWAENMPFSSEVIAEPYTVSASCPSTRILLTFASLQIPVPNSPTALAVPPQLEFSSFETSGQFNDTTTPYLAGGGSIVGTYTPYTDFPGAINAAM